MKRFICWSLSAIIAVGLALVISVSFEVIEIEDWQMVQSSNDGEKALVYKLHPEMISAGDLVLCRIPYYEMGTSGRYGVRRVVAVDKDKVKIDYSLESNSSSAAEIQRSDILGRVLIKMP